MYGRQRTPVCAVDLSLRNEVVRGDSVTWICDGVLWCMGARGILVRGFCSVNCDGILWCMGAREIPSSVILLCILGYVVFLNLVVVRILWCMGAREILL